MSPEEVINRIAEASIAIGWQAGVGGMETAGSIVSYLSAHPERIEAFMSGAESPTDWPLTWIEHGCLSWHGQDGKIYHPDEVRRHRIIKKLEKGA